MKRQNKISSDSESLNFSVLDVGASDNAAAARGFDSTTGCLGAGAQREPGVVNSVVALAEAIPSPTRTFKLSLSHRNIDSREFRLACKTLDEDRENLRHEEPIMMREIPKSSSFSTGMVSESEANAYFHCIIGNRRRALAVQRQRAGRGNND